MSYKTPKGYTFTNLQKIYRKAFIILYKAFVNNSYTQDNINKIMESLNSTLHEYGYENYENFLIDSTSFFNDNNN